MNALGSHQVLTLIHASAVPYGAGVVATCALISGNSELGDCDLFHPSAGSLCSHKAGLGHPVPSDAEIPGVFTPSQPRRVIIIRAKQNVLQVEF